MRIFGSPCDIKILTADQAWENYCSALQLATSARAALDRHRWASIARLSLDQYFARLEVRLPHEATG